MTLLKEIDSAAAAIRSAETDGDVVARLYAMRHLGFLLKERQQTKDRWIADARREFVSSSREPCRVCGRFLAVTHAHHVIPLSLQYDSGKKRANHDHVWLCPTHHAVVHVLLVERADAVGVGRATASVIIDLELSEQDAVMGIVAMAWGAIE